MMLHRHFEDQKEKPENMTRTSDLLDNDTEKPDTEETVSTNEQRKRRRKKHDD